MYHPMLTFAVMQTKQDDLARDLRRREMGAAARRPGSSPRVGRTAARRLAAYVGRRTRTTATQVPSVGS